MKSLFRTPKRAILSTLVIVLLVLILAAVITVLIIRASLVSKDTAQQLAWEDAGIARENVDMSHADLDWENGSLVYDVTFYSNGMEYEYVILAKEGVILEREHDGTQRETTPTSEGSVSATETTTAIPEQTAAQTYTSAAFTADESAGNAQAVALAEAGLTAEEVTFTEVKSDRKNGVPAYEIQFFTSDATYEYTILAADNTIHKVEIDWRQTNTSTNTSGSLSADHAKDIALQHAELDESTVTITKLQMEQDDGRSVYEVEFFSETATYQYEMDASSGALMKYEYERR